MGDQRADPFSGPCSLGAIANVPQGLECQRVACPKGMMFAAHRQNGSARRHEPQGRAAYERFGLNDRQIELIARATPKRHYYVQSRRGNRLFELALGPIALSLCGASDPETQNLVDALLRSESADGFLAAFLEARGFSWASELIADFPGAQRTDTEPITPQQKELL